MKISTVLMMIPIITLIGCTGHPSYIQKTYPNTYLPCRKISAELHLPALYPYNNAHTLKNTATNEARLRKEYKHYGCNQVHLPAPQNQQDKTITSFPRTTLY